MSRLGIITEDDAKKRLHPEVSNIMKDPKVEETKALNLLIIAYCITNFLRDRKHIWPRENWFERMVDWNLLFMKIDGNFNEMCVQRRKFPAI